MKKSAKFKKLAAVLLSLAILAGCGPAAVSTAEDSAAPAPAEESVQTAAVETAPEPEVSTMEVSSSAEETPAVEENKKFVPVEYTFPLVEEPETLSFFATMSPMITGYIENYGDNAAVQALEELTGVHIEYECYIPENAQTQFNLQAAAGSLPDILMGATEYYAGGMDTAVEEDILLNLADYLDECPNYSQILELAPKMQSSLTTEDGNLTGFYAYTDPDIVTPVTGAVMVRGDWLEQVGMEVPTTYNEVRDVLTAFKDELSVETPMIVTSYLDDMGGSFASGYDIKAFFMTSPGIQVPFYVVDGEVKCAIVEDDFVSYVEMLQGLMNDGLAAKDIESYTNENSYKDKVLSGEAGLFWGFGINDLETLNSQLTDGYFTVLPMMRQTEDQVLHFVSSESYAAKSAVGLSANCSDVELACRWLDAHYTDEVSMLAMYGIEGVSYEYDGDAPHYTEMMTDTSEGLTLNVNKALYCLTECDNIYYGSINTDLDTYTETQIEALEYINSGNTDDAYVYPEGASMTTEETEEYTDLIADLSTYMAEHVLKFVTGEEDMSEYPTFVGTLEDMGMQTVIDLKQAAYDRFAGA